MRFHKKYLITTALFTVFSISHAQDAKKAAATATPAVAGAASSSAPTLASKVDVKDAKSAKVEAAKAPAPAASGEVAAPQAAEKSGDFSAKDVWDKELFERDDNKVLVIQDRKYNKEGRLELGVDLGMTSATAFYNTYSFGLRSAYYFSEYWGIQGFGNYSINSDTNEKEQLENFLTQSNFASTKEFLQPKFFGGLGVIWNPIYGKFAWFRSRIIHFDIYAGLGVSVLTMDSTFNKPASGAGAQKKGDSQTAIGSLANLGIRVFLSKNFAWTTEVRNNIYQAKYAATTSGGPGAVPIAAKKVLQNNFQFMTGVSYMFNIAGY